ncbi:hypothetical protein FQA39_LY11572 [Lamprigera yunnana]|nr:hypothetical protein FQA39_LY11572 [Lamprigera yunnana]
MAGSTGDEGEKQSLNQLTKDRKVRGRMNKPRTRSTTLFESTIEYLGPNESKNQIGILLVTINEQRLFYNTQPSVSGYPNYKVDETQPSVSVSNNITSRSPNISIEDISPLPTSSVVTKNGKPRKGGKHGVLNNTPGIEIAKAIIAEKEAATLRKSAREVKRELVIEESEGIKDVSVEDDEEDNHACIY